MIRRIALYGVGLLAALAVGVTAVGYALPQDHVASREVVFPAAPAAVFAVIADVGRYPEWRVGVTTEIVSTDPLTWRETSGGDVVTFKVEEKRAPELLRVRIADPDLPFGGSWTYELAPAPSGTRLRITEHGEVYNPIFRFMSRFVFGHTATIDGFIAALEKRLHPS